MKTEIFDIKVNLISMKETIMKIEALIKEKKPSHIMGVNADKVNLSRENEDIREIINRCAITNADGYSMVLAAKIFGYNVPERVAGIDLMTDLLELANQKGYNTAYIGTKEDILNKMLNNLSAKYENLNISYYRNGYFSQSEWETIGNELTQRNVDIVFVGITSPLKEYLIDYWVENQNVKSVFLGVGGSFDVLANEISRAPKWMQNIGMEWFFRMMKEPKRLFKRYLIGNSKFILLAFKEFREHREKTKCKTI